MIIIFFKRNKKNSKYEKAFTALGTINSIIAYGEKSEEAVTLAYNRVVEIDNRMSAFKEDSDIMKINHNSGIKSQKVNVDTFNLIKQSVEFSLRSKGDFDISIRPLTSLWGVGKKLNYIPEKTEIDKALGFVNYKDIDLDELNCTVYLKRKGQAIDLGGIAKGYAADEVKRIMEQHKIKDALINLGGNVVVLGKNPQGELWRIGIQNPFSTTGNYIGTVKITNKAVVTSGSNEQFFIKDGVRYHHIINPHTGYPVKKGLLSVTVICESSTHSDAITTALFVSDINEAIPMLKVFNAEGIFIMENQDVYVTEGLKENFERNF